jgi:arginine deiminase
MKIQVNSEIGKLKAAMMQRPGKEITRLTPSNMKSLLWDNIPWPFRATEEHHAYVDMLRKHGIEVHIMEDLLKDILKDKTLKKELITKSVDYESRRLSPQTLETTQRYMEGVDIDELINIFTGGISKEELNNRTNEVSLQDLADTTNEFCMTPMTNIGWSRDPAAAIGNGIAFSVMYGRAREREPLYVKYIFRYHPYFKDLKYHIWYGNSEEHTTTLEGGNVFPLSKNVLLIGLNERTHAKTILTISQNIMKHSEITDVLALQFDNKKLTKGDLGFYVHVDTFFTMVDQDAFLFYPYIEDSLNIFHLWKGEGGRIKTRMETNIFETFRRLLKLKSIRIIKVGGEDRVRSQAEQWGVGGNVFTLKPGVVIAWSRNVATNKELRKNSIEVIELDGNELSKVLGGPRCAVMPLCREEI